MIRCALLHLADWGYAASRPSGIQIGRLLISPTHWYLAGGKPVTPISRESPFWTG
ncbi:MAG: hypothetical protein JWL61_3881, partial [Gemmatimonadetes bacterium]|nr:hypothetical protein [Gemmatimonadota bacterium]